MTRSEFIALYWEMKTIGFVGALFLLLPLVAFRAWMSGQELRADLVKQCPEARWWWSKKRIRTEILMRGDEP